MVSPYSTVNEGGKQSRVKDSARTGCGQSGVQYRILGSN
jgi:hypothetical protein